MSMTGEILPIVLLKGFSDSKVEHIWLSNVGEGI